MEVGSEFSPSAPQQGVCFRMSIAESVSYVDIDGDKSMRKQRSLLIVRGKFAWRQAFFNVLLSLQPYSSQLQQFLDLTITSTQFAKDIANGYVRTQSSDAGEFI